MSLCTVVEIALQFESFRNIDLFHQGLYHLKTRIYRDDESRALAVPHSHLKGPTLVTEPVKGKAPRVDHHNLIPAHLNEELYTFSTRSFLIRYCEEEVELGDVGQFRLELGPSELERRQPLLLEVELMFADLTQPSGENLGDQPDVESAEFRCVSTQVLRLRGVERGLHDFCPVVFDECHFCLLNLAVHSAVLDLRFRLRPKQLAAAKPKVAGPAPRAGAKGEEDLMINPLGAGPFQLAKALEEKRSKQLEDLDRVDRLWEFRLCVEMLRDCLDSFSTHGERDLLSTADETLLATEDLLRRITELAVMHKNSDEALLDVISQGAPGSFAAQEDSGLLMQVLQSPDFREKGCLTSSLLSSRLMISGLLESVLGELTCWRSHPSEADLQAWKRWDRTYELLAKRVAAVQQSQQVPGVASIDDLRRRCFEGASRCDGDEVVECVACRPACTPLCGYGRA